MGSACSMGGSNADNGNHHSLAGAYAYDVKADSDAIEG